MRTSVNSAGRKNDQTNSSPMYFGHHRFFHILLITAIVVALFLGPITLLKLLDPAGPWFFLTLVIVIVVLEGGFSTWWLGKESRKVNRLAYRGSEIVMLIVGLRIFTWVLDGGLPDNETLRQFILEPGLAFDLTYLLFVFLAVVAWERSVTFASIYHKMILSPDEIVYYTTPTAERSRRGFTSVIPMNRNLLFQEYLRQWTIGGIILVLFVVLSTIDLPQASRVVTGNLAVRNVGRLGLRPEILLALMVYFIGGLWLASLGRMHVLHARWLTRRIPADGRIVRTWLSRGVLLLLIIAGAAALLPIGSSLAISKILLAILSILTAAVGAFFIIIFYLYYLLLSLLGSPPPQPRPSVDDVTRFVPSLAPNERVSDLPALIFGTLFWVAIACITIVAIIIFLRGRGIVIRLDSIRMIWRTIVHWLLSFWLMIDDMTSGFSFKLQNRLPPSERNNAKGRLPWRFLRINSLSPRDQVRYYYLSIVKRAGKKGCRRSPEMTPAEFTNKLEDELPESKFDLYSLTESFQRARYSNRHVEHGELPAIRSAFERIRSALRRRHGKNVSS